MGFIDNFELGVDGLYDLADHALGGHSTKAADLYAAQTAKLEDLTPEAQAEVQTDARQREATGGVLQAAAEKTVDQVVSAASSSFQWITIALAVAAGAVVLWFVRPFVVALFGRKKRS